MGERGGFEISSKADLWSTFFFFGWFWWGVGSIPELDPVDEKVYNTCTVYNPEGTLVAIHRKVHLFDIDIPGRVSLSLLFPLFELFFLLLEMFWGELIG